jgi:hypothetical protein
MKHDTSSRREFLVGELLAIPGTEVMAKDSWLELARTSLRPLTVAIDAAHAPKAREVLREAGAVLLTTEFGQERYLALSEDGVLHILLSVGSMKVTDTTGPALQLSGMTPHGTAAAKKVVEFLAVLAHDARQATLMHDDASTSWGKLRLHEQSAVLELLPRAARPSVEALLSTYDYRLLHMAHKRLKHGLGIARSVELAKKRLLVVTLLSKVSVVRHSVITAVTGPFETLATDAASLLSQAGFPSLAFDMAGGRLRALWTYYTNVLPCRLQGLNVFCYNWPQRKLSLTPRPAVVGCPLGMPVSLSDEKLASVTRALAVSHLWALKQRSSFVLIDPSAAMLSAAAACSVTEALRGCVSPVVSNKS